MPGIVLVVKVLRDTCWLSCSVEQAAVHKLKRSVRCCREEEEYSLLLVLAINSMHFVKGATAADNYVLLTA